MKATDMNKIKAEDRLHSVLTLLEDGDGVVNRTKLHEAIRAVRYLYLDQSVEVNKLLTEDDS